MKLSVIIATHNRPESLERLVLGLAPQLRPGDDELLIADNGTPARTPLPEGMPVAVHVHDRRPGKCRVQNQALGRARGAIIVFLDDDLVVAPDYIREVERFFSEHPEYAAMKGRILPIEDLKAAAGDKWVYLDLPIVDHGEAVVEVRGVMGANMAFRAGALHAVGPFDERLGPGASGHEEETEISARLKRAGYRIGYAPRAAVYHEVDPARADRDRFIRIARERGRSRMLHEHHSAVDVTLKNLIASARLGTARLLRASAVRLAREERRWAVARGMWDGFRAK